jgi:hypothetical protein
MTAARKKVHLPRPGTGGLLTDPLPLWCGLARDLDTCTTSFPHLATCARCIAAQQRYTEESDYQLMRAKRAAESEREAGAADRVHYSRNTTPGLTGLARAICGYWSEQVTADSEKVTCLACLRILRPPPKNKTRGRGAVHYLTAGSPDALVLAAALAACGPLPPETSTSSSSSGSEVLTSGVETTSTSGESSSYASSSSDDSSSSSSSRQQQQQQQQRAP